MSTRCSIIIKSECRNEPHIYLYHHHDGYPQGVGANLLNYLAKKWSRGWWYGETIANDLLKGKQPSMYAEYEGTYPNYEYKRDENGKIITRKDDEYEISTSIHSDVDYIYVINCKAKTLRCVRGNSLKGMRYHLVEIKPNEEYYEGNINY